MNRPSAHSAQGLTHSLQLLTVVGGLRFGLGTLLDVSVGPFQSIRPGAHTGVARARTIRVGDDHLLAAHGAAMRSQLEHCTSSLPVRDVLWIARAIWASQ